MSNHVHILLLGTVFSITVLSSCQPLSDPNVDRFPTSRTPITVAPSVSTNGAELYARNPVVESQTTGTIPNPIRSLSAGETLTILQKDGRFSQVRLMDGTVGYMNSSDITQGSNGYTGGYDGNRVPDQHGNRFGGGTQRPEDLPPTTYPPVGPITPTDPTRPTSPDADMIDLDNF